MNYHIFLVEDDDELRTTIRKSIAMDSVLVHDFDSWSALRLFKEEVVPDLAILDLNLLDGNGISVFSELKKNHPGIEGIIITGQPTFQNALSSLKIGVNDYLEKPFRAEELREAIKQCESYKQFHYKRSLVDKQVMDSRKVFRKEWGLEFIGKSAAVKKINFLMNNVAAADGLSVLITGESGCGKELIAKGIHGLSGRRNRAFCPVNCTAIPESLFESEFFGYHKGAFTGALQCKEGWFEKANGGTLFLDEIGDLSLALQSKLLRVLDDGKIYRLGAHEAIDVDVRVICATNKNLKQMVEEGTFRLDLYHRLNAFTIHVPALRFRNEDIPILANHFLKKYAEKHHRNVKCIHSKAIGLLENYAFPGNIRELKNIIERAVIMAPCDTVTPSVLMFSDAGPQASPTDNGLNLDDIEKEAIVKALQICRYNKTLAAEELNITRQALNRKLKKHCIE